LEEQAFEFRVLGAAAIGGQTLVGGQRADGRVRLAGIQVDAVEQRLVVLDMGLS